MVNRLGFDEKNFRPSNADIIEKNQKIYSRSLGYIDHCKILYSICHGALSPKVKFEPANTTELPWLPTFEVRAFRNTMTNLFTRSNHLNCGYLYFILYF